MQGDLPGGQVSKVPVDICLAMGPQRDFPHERSVLDLFSESVAAAPGRPALLHQETIISYGELDHASDVVAAHLIAAGVARQSLVPVLVTDGLEFPAALLGVMKAGAAFVPLDPAWPADRLGTISADLAAAAIVTTEQTESVAAELNLAPRRVPIRLEVLLATNADMTELPQRRPEALDLIYGFYTSGSTGTPKCALNVHRGLVNRLCAMSRRFGHGSEHVALQNSRSTFDSSMWQVLWPLTTGGQVVLPHRDGILDLEATALTIGRYGVTITDFVPSVLVAFVSLLESRPGLREAVSSLRRMLVGGEAANASVVQRIREVLPGLEVTNTYGPTECSIGSVFHEVTDADTETIPLGHPIDNTAAIVLDDQMRPVAPGDVGEIFLGGECIGAGYLNDKARTAKAFVLNPFPQIGGELLYRTGDLAKPEADGTLHFIGRRDDQVKVGGVRVELGEVAAAFAAHPMVGNALAVVLGTPPDARLVCCVTPRVANQPPSLVNLRRHALDNLPKEFVPHRIMVLDQLPLNRNGKADRRALTAMLEAQPVRQVEPVAQIDPPVTPMEELICAAWQEVLGVEQVSVTVPFAEYGGTSLTAYQVTAAVGARLGHPVRPRDLLVASTVRAQAARLTNSSPEEHTELQYLRRDLDWKPPLAVFLTGATGFIGAHILAELLQHSDSNIICLVRAATAAEGARRLEEALQHYRLTSPWQLLPMAIKAGRVEVVCGDLSRERFGLPESRFARLASGITSVIHAGATVNMVAGYLEHRPVNVVGTQELIKLAALANGCRLHVLSTLSIFPLDEDLPRPIDEGVLPVPDRVATDGYSRSKYVSERLLENARRLGIRSVVYRLGEVWPHSQIGIPNPASLAHNILYACVRTGCVFDTAAQIDVTPVDAVSRFITRCAVGDVLIPDRTLHVLWPGTLPLTTAMRTLAGNRGLDHVSYAEFRRRLEVLAEPPEPDAALARLRLLLPAASKDPAAPQEFDQMFTPCAKHFDMKAFQRFSAGQAPAMDDPLSALNGYLSRLSRTPDTRHDKSSFTEQEIKHV